MAIGRGKVEWDRGAFFAAHVHLSLTGQAIDYTTLIPKQFQEKRAKRELPPEEMAAQTKLGLQILGSALGDRR